MPIHLGDILQLSGYDGKRITLIVDEQVLRKPPVNLFDDQQTYVYKLVEEIPTRITGLNDYMETYTQEKDVNYIDSDISGTITTINASDTSNMFTFQKIGSVPYDQMKHFLEYKPKFGWDWVFSFLHHYTPQENDARVSV